MPAAAIVGGSVVSGLIGANASKKAAKAQSASDAAAIEEQRRQFDLSRGDLAPWRGVGSQAINQLGSLYGFSPTMQAPQGGITQATLGGSAGIGDLARRFGESRGITQYPGAQQQAPSGAAPNGMAGFWASPDYQFRRDEGQRDIGNSFAARGGAFSGNALRGLTDFNSNLAAGEFGNYFNRLAALSGIGQAATNTGVQAGQQSAQNIGNLLSNQGAARASGIMGQANSLSGALNSGLNNYLLYNGGYFG
jgi:hypothetical protein